MQRCLFFFSLWSWGISLIAQPIDIQKTEISFWFNEQHKEDLSIQAEAVLSFDILYPVDSILFTARGLKINTIKKQEGRLKDQLDFRNKGDSLWIYSSFKEGSTSLFFGFEILWNDEIYDPYIQQTSDFTAFNPFNIGESSGKGTSGLFFPSIAGDMSRLHINLTMPKEQNSSAPGTLAFTTDNQDGTHSHYWSSYGEFAPEDFFLIAGEFEAADREELEDEFDFIEIDPTQLIANRVQPKLEALVQWAGAEENFSDSTYALIDSLSQLKLSGFYLRFDDVAAFSDSMQFRLEKTALLYLENGDTATASDNLLEYYKQLTGPHWLKEFVRKNWESLPSQSRSDQRITMRLKLEEWRKENEFLQNFDQQVLDTVFTEILLDSLKIPAVDISYRYRSSDTAQYILYSQDTSRAPVYHIPVKITLIHRQDSTTAYRFMDEAEGSLKVKSSSTPSYVGVDLGEGFPGTFKDNAPDNYSLYILSNAEEASQRREALRRLFTTTNQNLFSTVLGIAMNDENPVVRLEAMERADDLNAAAQRKLEDTITKLSEEDPNPKVQSQAKSLVQKYYADK